LEPFFTFVQFLQKKFGQLFNKTVPLIVLLPKFTEMLSCTTNGITVSVETQYLPEHSNPRGQKFIFGYHIAIENRSGVIVKLLRRHWHITDSNGSVREVEGEGVVGRQPVLQPGDSHEYLSFCNLFSEIGKMRGTYTMLRMDTNTFFEVEVPEFQMVAPAVLN
jgi:ApaG protein